MVADELQRIDARLDLALVRARHPAVLGPEPGRHCLGGPRDAGLEPSFRPDEIAVFLFAVENTAAANSRIQNVQIRPDSWAALLRTWRIPADRLIDRDRVER